MVKLTALPDQAIIDGFKGKIDFYVHDGVACVRRWPRSPGRRRSPAVMAQWPAFTSASRLWSYLSPEVQNFYISMGGNSNLSGRDLFMRSYISGIYRYPHIKEKELKLTWLDASRGEQRRRW